MSKLSPAVTVATVVMHPGQPSTGLLAKLKEAGERLTDAQIMTAIDNVDMHRVAFQSGAVVAGVFLLARKQTVKHGEWLPWCEKFASVIVAKVAARCQFEMKADATARSIRVYTQLAQRFLADLEQNSFQAEGKDEQVQPPKVSIEEVMALEVLDPERRGDVLNSIERFVGGRSLRRMLIDFRGAESSADQEEIEAASETAKRKAKKSSIDPRQMHFEEMLQPIGVIDTLFESRSFVEKTDKAFWLSIADKLTTQAARARQLAKEIR